MDSYIRNDKIILVKNKTTDNYKLKDDYTNTECNVITIQKALSLLNYKIPRGKKSQVTGTISFINNNKKVISKYQGLFPNKYNIPNSFKPIDIPILLDIGISEYTKGEILSNYCNCYNLSLALWENLPKDDEVLLVQTYRDNKWYFNIIIGVEYNWKDYEKVKKDNTDTTLQPLSIYLWDILSNEYQNKLSWEQALKELSPTDNISKRILILKKEKKSK